LRVDSRFIPPGVLRAPVGTLPAAPEARAVKPGPDVTVREFVVHAAGLVTGVWADLDALRAEWRRASEWVPNMDADVRERRHRKWVKAVELAKGWIDEDDADDADA
jgi:glycerol kinase